MEVFVPLATTVPKVPRVLMNTHVKTAPTILSSNVLVLQTAWAVIQAECVTAEASPHRLEIPVQASTVKGDVLHLCPQMEIQGIYVLWVSTALRVVLYTKNVKMALTGKEVIWPFKAFNSYLWMEDCYTHLTWNLSGCSRIFLMLIECIVVPSVIIQTLRSIQGNQSRRRRNDNTSTFWKRQLVLFHVLARRQRRGWRRAHEKKKFWKQACFIIRHRRPGFVVLLRKLSYITVPTATIYENSFIKYFCPLICSR